MRIRGILFGLFCLFIGQASASATVLVYENFESYTAGISMNTVAAGGTGLTGNWGKTGAPDTLSTQNTSAMSYSSGNIIIDGNSKYGQMKGTSNYYYAGLSPTLSNDNDYYFSFLMRSNGIAATAGEFGTLQLASTNTSSPERISAGVTGDGANSYVFSRDTTSSAGTTVSSLNTGTPNPQALTAGTTYFVTGKLVSDGAKFTEMYLWVNPNDSASEGAGALWASADILTGTGYTSDIAYLGLRNFNMAAADTFEVDEVRIGQSWSDVTVVPEPSTFALLALGAGAIFVRRRKNLGL